MIKVSNFLKRSNVQTLKILFLTLFIFVLINHDVFCDSPSLQLYKRHFSDAEYLPAKYKILEDAITDKSMQDSLTQFYEYVLQFVIDYIDNSNNDDIQNSKNDPYIIKIVETAISGFQKIRSSENWFSDETHEILRKLFAEYKNSNIGTDIIVTTGKIGKGNRKAINEINQLLTENNTAYKSGLSVNYSITSACISSIIELGDDSSYPVLFDVIISGYPEVITYEAYGAIEIMRGNLFNFLSKTIQENAPYEKYLAAKIGINSDRLNVTERGLLAELALEKSLAVNDNDKDPYLNDMRYAAVAVLVPLRWTRVSDSAVKHYYRVFNDYQRSTASKEQFIEAITFLGSVGNFSSALILGLQLGLINDRTQKTGEYDSEITLAIIRSLGLIGDKSAFDNLLYVNNLSYKENIKIAAKEAINRLKW